MKDKSISLDIFRLIAAFLIVAIHTYPFISINESVDFVFTHVICRIGVPLFLMITGYFILPKALENKEVIKNYIVKIIKIYVICMIIYLPVNIYAHKLDGILNVLKDIFLNGTFYHLWYFPALILGIIITYAIIKNTKPNVAKTLFIILFVIGLFGDSYYGISEKFELTKSIYNVIFDIFEYTRNGLFYVPIFLYIGYMIKNTDIKISKKSNIILIITFLILMVFEGIILNHFNLQRHDSMYIMLIPLMICIFNFLIKNTSGSNKKLRNISTIIYITHPLFIIVVRGIAKILHIQNLLIDNSIIHYLSVIAFTVIFSLCFEILRNGIIKIYEAKRKSLDRIKS